MARWLPQHHSKIKFVCLPSVSVPSSSLINTTSDKEFYQVLSTNFCNNKILQKRILNALHHAAYFLVYVVQLGGVYVQRPQNQQNEEWMEYLSKPHCLILALFGKVLDFPEVNARVHSSLLHQLHDATSSSFARQCKDYSVWQLLSLFLEKNLILDTHILRHWCDEWFDREFFDRCQSIEDLQGLFPKDSRLRFRVGTGCTVAIVNQFNTETKQFRPSAERDDKLFRATSQLLEDTEMVLWRDFTIVQVLSELNRLNESDMLLESDVDVAVAPNPMDGNTSTAGTHLNPKVMNVCRELCILISSHGEQGCFYGNDNLTYMRVDDLVNRLLNLAPRVERVFVVLQACQGPDFLKGVTTDERHINLQFSQCEETCPISFLQQDWMERVNLKDTELYCLQAALPGFQAPAAIIPRNTLATGLCKGSLMIEEFFQEVKKAQHNQDYDEECPFSSHKLDKQLPKVFRNVLKKFKNVECVLNQQQRCVFRAMMKYSSPKCS